MEGQDIMFCDGSSVSKNAAERPNVYMPQLTRIVQIWDETPDTRTLRLQFQNEETRNNFTFRAGQFALYSVFGSGECVFCIASSPTKKGYIECSFKKVGKVTSALRDLVVGDTVGFRGPYGNSFPLEKMKGKNLLFVGGGIGLAPLRSLIDNVLDLRAEFGNITILYGARSVSDLVYKPQLKEWGDRSDINFIKTVDPGGEDKSWDGKVGFVPTVLSEVGPTGTDSMAIVCGPPIMIKFTLQALKKLGFADENIITTLENRMKCGFGKCGRCNVGPTYVCKDGPVFSAAELASMPGADL